ncbi:MAG TPA: ADP-ribosylglycohydrolase family protein [Candidatus Saccharimonadia bacterium]|nr:ADP-ribosylglycohydrolase family protein [Candidatus Saccharimonadia bacterium]
MNGNDTSIAKKLNLARLALTGLSVGDAFGEQFFTSDQVLEMRFETRQIPPPPWFVTDDTIMGTSIVEVLEQHGVIGQEALAKAFARRYARDPSRGYGGTAHRILRAMNEDVPWEVAAGEAFDGMGSMGNGGAMRAAPVGAYFAHDGVATVIEQARRSAEVTHAHEEGQAGAVAVALAAMYAVLHGPVAGSHDLLQFVHEHMPAGETKGGIRRAASVPFERPPAVIADMLGSGNKVISQDTVPFSLWCAARHLDSFTSALWSTVSGLGDRDTTCAIVGGIVALAVGPEGIPDEWLASREALPG